jgi:hypothetical protein
MTLTPGTVGAISASTTGSVTPATPAGSADDILILHLSHYAGGTEPVPYDFTSNAHTWAAIGTHNRITSGTQIGAGAWWCRRGASYPGDPVLHTSVVGGNAMYARIFLIDDDDPYSGTPVEGYNFNDGGAGTKTGPTTTTLGDNRLVFNLFSVANVIDMGNPSGGYTELYETSDTTSFDSTLAADYIAKATAGSQAGTTKTGGNHWSSIGFALFQAADAGGGGGTVPPIVHHLKMQGIM